VTEKPEIVLAAQKAPSQSNYDTLLQKYFGSQWQTAHKVMMCESRGNPTAHNNNWLTGDDSWGLMQINLFGPLKYSRPDATLLVNPEFNIRYAAGMYHSQGWKPWGCARRMGIV
jgi:hypothetical protein